MIDVYLYNFLKRYNSTAAPSTDGQTPVQCKLKTPCSILKPVLELSINPSNITGMATTANYVYIPDFNRYYFVVNTVMNGRLLDLYLDVDVLGSYKTVIGNSTQYVLRSASSYNGTIKDTKYPVRAVNPDRTSNSGVYGTQVPNPFQPPSNSFGVFVVGVVAKGGTFGTVNYYAMSQLVFIAFMLQLFNLTTQWADGGTDLADGLKKAITDPMQYVTSVMWYPYVVGDFVSRGFASATTSITVGYDTISLSASAYSFDTVLNIQFTNLVGLTIPAHPQASSRGSYMNFEPFSRYYLSFYPFCSLCELDSTQVGGKGTIYVLYTVDLRSGKGICNVCTEFNGTTYADWSPRSPLRVFEAQIGVPLPVGAIHTELQNLSQYLTNTAIATANEFGGFEQASTKITNTLSNKIMGGIAKLFGSEDLQNMVNDIDASADTIHMGDLSKIASNAASMKSTCEMIGSQGTISTYSRMPLAAWGNFYSAANDAPTLFGRPLCQSVQLSTLSGFIQCDNPKLALSSGMTITEQADIERFMATGFFRE